MKQEIEAFQDEQGKWYRAYAPKPEGVVQRSHNGSYARLVDKREPDGSVSQSDVLVCEDCWADIPKYVDFPRGLVSPESDGDGSGNYPKHRKTFLQGLEATEALQKSVCLDCFNEAFRRMNPGIKVPPLRNDVHLIASLNRIEQPAETFEYVGEPRL